MSYWTHHILPAYNSETKVCDIKDDITGAWCKILKTDEHHSLVEVVFTYEQVWVSHTRLEKFTD